MRNKGSALLKGITKFALATALFMGIALFTGFVPVAKAADSRVSTLEALRKAVNAGGKIVLEADISLDSDASDTDKSDNYLTINSNTVLDLNGHKIYRELSPDAVTNGYIIYVPAGRSLTILDSAGGGYLTGGNSTYMGIRPSAVYVRGTLVLNGGSIRNNRNAARSGGAMVVEGGTFTMNGGEICGNEGIDGGVVIANGRFTMNGGSIHGNKGTSNAGGVYMTNNATNVFTMNGGYIRDNTCRDRGAGVYVQNGAFTLNGGEIRGNQIKNISSSAIGCGGGVYVEYGSFTMTGGSITGNSAYPGSTSERGGSGGGVYLSSNSSGATISGGRVTGNTTGVGKGSSMEFGNGAGIYVGRSLTVSVSGAPVIAGNTQDGRPNDLYLKSESGKLAIGEGGLQAGASIGIMHFEHNQKFREPSPTTTFTDGLGGNTGVFFANAFYYNNLDKMYEYAIQRDGDEAQLTYVGDSDLTVTFMRGDGTDAVHATQRVISGGSVSRPAEPVWNGHVFEGWHTDAETATPYAFGGELTDNLTLYAHWVESATVTFHANGGMGGMEPQVFGKGLEQNLNPSLFFRDYCIFDGWTANADGTGDKYADRAAIKVTGDTNLYALWMPIKYNINIPPTSNGKVTAKVGEKDNATTANYNDTVTLTVTPNPGYMLDTLTVKQGEADVTVTDNRFTMPAGDVTVSATFKLIPATAPAIDTQPSDLSLTYGYTTGSVLSVAASAAEGHTLSYQWYSNASATSEGGTEISGATEASYAIPTGKTAGTTEYYYCVVTATHTDNSQTAETTSNTATVSIGKAPLTITANSKSIHVGDAIPALDDYKVEWLLNQDALTTAPTLVYQKNGEVVTPDNTTAGTYDIVPSGANAGNNYSISYTNGTLTISEKQPATVTKAPEAKTLTYNGQAQALVTAGEAEGGTMQYALGTEDDATEPYTASIPSKTDAGIYYVWYRVAGDENHTDTQPISIKVTISTVPVFSVLVTDDGNGTASANPVSGETGTEVTLTAEAKEGYRFREWQVISGGVTVTENRFTIGSANAEIRAVFEEIPEEPAAVYTVTVLNDDNGTASANPASGETGTEVTLKAEAKEGYRFREWQVISGGVTVTENRFTIGSANAEIRAVFEEIPEEPAAVYTVTVTNDGNGTASANPASGETGTEVTLTAEAKEGYRFREWQVISGGVTVTDNRFTIGNASVEIRAVFEEIPEEPAAVYTVTVINDGNGTASANPASGETGTEVTLTAEAKEGYRFREWQVISGGVTVTDNRFRIGSSNAEIRAVFEEIPEEPAAVYTVTVINDGNGTASANPASGETGIEVTLTAEAKEGYRFREWQVISGGVTVTDNRFRIGSANAEIRAVFEEIPVEPAAAYTVTVLNDGNGTASANPASGETGTEVTLTAKAKEGYRFREWQVISGGVTVTDNRFTIGSTNAEIRAVFEEIPVEPVQPVTYATVSVVGVMYTIGSGENAVITVERSTGDKRELELFTGAAVDGIPVPDGSYSAAKGSLILTLKSAYLDTLREGEHKVTISFQDGSAEAALTIKPAMKPAVTALPKTGDGAKPVLWLGMIAAGLAVAFVAGFVKKRRDR